MIYRHGFRTVLFCTAWSILLTWICQAQSDLPGISPSGTTNRSVRGANSTSQGSGSRTQPNVQRPRNQLIFISGTVVMEDGSEIPRNIAIERVCGNRRIKETYADSSGSFSFQVGGNASIVPDASDDGFANRNVGWSSALGVPSSNAGADLFTTELFGCDLQAHAVGYRSSSVLLASYPASSQIHIGTLVLQPLARAKGTRISVVSLQAPKNAKNALEKAEHAEQRKRLEQAEKYLLQAVELYPGFATAWFDLGQLKMRKQQFETARGDFEKSIAADPSYILPYLELARIAIINGDWPKAVEISDKAIALDSIGFPEAYLLNSQANFNLNNVDLSEKSVRKALRLDAGHRYAQGYILLANILQVKRDYQGTAEQLRNYLKFAATDSNIQKVKARLDDLEKVNSILAAGPPAP